MRFWHAGAAALALLAASVAAVPAAAEEVIRIGGTGSALGTMRLLAAEYTAAHPEVRFSVVPSLGSGGGIKAVLAGAIDLAVTSRALDEAERARGAVETEYARTPFVLAVSAKSGTHAISTAQLAQIYGGKLAQWADGSPVRIVLRPSQDQDSLILKGFSPEMRQALEAAEARPGVQFSVNDQDAADDLERIPGAVGPCSLALIVSEKRALRALTLDGREPTAANAAAGTYPYHKQLSFVTGAKRAAAVERFIAFVRSPAGLRILANNGQWTR